MITRILRIPPLLLILAFALLLLLPPVLFGATGVDVLVNCMKVRLFAQQFWHGDLYPRWLMDQFAGNGSPIFFYYPPLTYFITSFFIFLAPLDPFGYFPIAASVCLAIFIAGVGFYAWMKDEGLSQNAALTGSLLYMSAPVMLGLHFYYIMLFPSVWAWAWLPLLLMYARHIADVRPYAALRFALVLAALIMTNIPMTIIFGPIAACYSLMYWRKETFVRNALMLGGATVLAAGLTAISLVPAAAYLDYSLAKMFWQADSMDYHHYLVNPGFTHGNQKVFTTCILIMAALSLYYGVLLRHKPKIGLYFATISFIGLFMTMRVSLWVWDHLPLMKTIQFPERFLMVPSLCLAVLGAFALPRLRLLAGGLVIFYVFLIFIMAHLDTRVSEDYLRKYEHARYERYILNVDFGGLLTSRNLIPLYFTPQKLAALDMPHDNVATITGDAVAHVTTWRPREIVFHYKAGRDSLLRVWQFYFPGRVAFLGDTILNVNRDVNTGQTLIDVPAGEGDIRLILTQLMPEIVGKMISIFCLGLLMIGFLLECRYRKIRALSL